MSAEIDYTSPIYLQLREVVRTKIEEGEYLPGTAIPSENEFSEMFGINRLTVRNAVETLVYEGILKRVQGKGVYVMGKKNEQNLDKLEGFTPNSLNKTIHERNKILAKIKRPAGEYFGDEFSINPSDDIYYTKQVFFSNDEPVSIKEMYVPMNVVPKIEGIDLTVFNIFEVYNFYGIKLKHAYQTLDLAKLEPNDARVLNVPPDTVAFLLICKTFDESERLIEFSRTFIRGDKY